jgi:hypothetical protein
MQQAADADADDADGAAAEEQNDPDLDDRKCFRCCEKGYCWALPRHILAMGKVASSLISKHTHPVKADSYVLGLDSLQLTVCSVTVVDHVADTRLEKGLFMPIQVLHCPIRIVALRLNRV